MDALRAAEDRFDDLPGFPYAGQYVEVDRTRLGYVEETGDGEETLLRRHGEPTWSDLYRSMLPVLAERGRAVALDLPGLGRSDTWPDGEDDTDGRLYDAVEGNAHFLQEDAGDRVAEEIVAFVERT